MSAPVIRPYKSLKDFNNVKLMNLSISIAGSVRGYAKEGKILSNIDNYIFEAGLPLVAQGQFMQRFISKVNIKMFEFTTLNLCYGLGITNSLIETYDGSTNYYTDYWTDVLSDMQLLTFKKSRFGSKEFIRVDLDGLVDSGDVPVLKSIDGVTTYTRNTDYVIDGKRGIIYQLPNGSIISEQQIRIKYKCLPIAGQVLPLDASSFELGEEEVIIEATNATNGKKMIIFFPKAHTSGTFDISQDAPWAINIEINAVKSETHSDYPMGYARYNLAA